MFRDGKLERLYLLSPDFGGEESAANCVYVPVGVASAKERMDNNIIRPLIEDGKITKYSAVPEYQGKSFIPVSIRIEASDPGSFSTRIAIWGKALLEEESTAKSTETNGEPDALFQLKESSEYDMSSPEATVKEFIDVSDKWNNWAYALSEAEGCDDNRIDDAYSEIINQLCDKDVTPQGVSYGNNSSHSLSSEAVINTEVTGNSAVVFTKHTGALDFESDYEYHLTEKDGKWLITSLLYVCDDGKYECL